MFKWFKKAKLRNPTHEECMVGAFKTIRELEVEERTGGLGMMDVGDGITHPIVLSVKGGVWQTYNGTEARIISKDAALGLIADKIALGRIKDEGDRGRYLGLP